MASISSMSMPLLLIVVFIATLVSSGKISRHPEISPKPSPQLYHQIRELEAQERTTSFVNDGECIFELTRVSQLAINGVEEGQDAEPPSNIERTCCKKFMEINNSGRPKMYLNPLILQKLKRYCASISGLENVDVGFVRGSVRGPVRGPVASPAPAPV